MASDARRIGRPKLNIETETLNVKVPRELMTHVRQLTGKTGATLAAFVRQALEEKVARETEEHR